MQLRRVPGLKNNGVSCSVNKLVSNRRVAPTAPTPAVSTRESPRLQPPPRLKMGIESPDGTKKAVPSIHPRFREESPCGRLDGLGMGHGTGVEQDDDAVRRRPVDRKGNALSNKVCCSHRSEKRVLQLVSVGKRELRSENRDAEMNSTRLRRVPDLENNKICCSMNEKISRRRVVPMAPLPAVQTSCLPDFQRPTCSKACNDFPYNP
jgi:hypothetical protein